MFRRSRRVVAHSPRVVIDEAGAGHPRTYTFSAGSAGVAALAGSSFPSPEEAVPQASVPAFPAGAPNPTTASFPELNAVELQLIADGRMINAVKTYRDRTGVDLKTAKAAIDAAR